MNTFKLINSNVKNESKCTCDIAGWYDIEYLIDALIKISLLILNKASYYLF